MDPITQHPAYTKGQRHARQQGRYSVDHLRKMRDEARTCLRAYAHNPSAYSPTYHAYWRGYTLTIERMLSRLPDGNA